MVPLVMELKDIMSMLTAAGAIGAGIAAGIYAYKSKGGKDLKENVDKIATKIAEIQISLSTSETELMEIKKYLYSLEKTNTDDHTKIFETINATTDIIKKLIENDNLDKAIDNILVNAEAFINGDHIVAAFFELCAALIKQILRETLKTGISNMSKIEIKAKIDYARYEIREYYHQFEPGFLSIIKPKLTELIEKYIEDLYSIHDDIINDKNLRLKITSTLLLQHTYSYIVQERHTYLSLHPNKNIL
jgi:hypothetical protein